MRLSHAPLHAILAARRAVVMNVMVVRAKRVDHAPNLPCFSILRQPNASIPLFILTLTLTEMNDILTLA